MTPIKSHIIIARPGFSGLLTQELSDRWTIVGKADDEAAVAIPQSAKLPALADTVFARQILPLATSMDGEDLTSVVKAVSRRLEVLSGRANRRAGRWTLHVFGLDDDVAKERAARLERMILQAVHKDVARFAKRFVDSQDLVKDGVVDSDLIVQVYVTPTTKVWISTATLSSGVSPYVAGTLRMRHRAGAPSRSARKLDEAFVALGREPAPDETAVDLGAAPGGWTFTLARRGVSVTAVDHAALDLPPTKALVARVNHLKENGLKYRPVLPVDWLCCDMVVDPRETLRTLAAWLDGGLMRNFVVNIKLPQQNPWPVVREALALLETHPWSVMRVRHLYHDRREVTLLGSR